MPKVPSEIISEQYQLRATFFSNSLEKFDYLGLFDFVKNNLSSLDASITWGDVSRFGVNEDVFNRLKAENYSPCQHFCHPNVLLSNPRYLVYYRCISAFSQKGLKSVSGVSSVDKLEQSAGTMNSKQATAIAKAINENLSAIYSIALPEQEKLKGLMYATAGTSIDGSWRNKIGTEGERVIRTLFLKTLLENSEIVSVTKKNGDEIGSGDLSIQWLDENTPLLASALLSNGSVIQFGSEPDIKLIDHNARVVGGVEIKAGIDPAGALERLGAMMKSFENIRAEATNAETILVASCITDEVDQRLRNMSGVRTFITTDVMQNTRKQGTKLINIMRAALGLTGSFQ